MSEEKLLEELISECGNHLLCGLLAGNITAIASFSFPLSQYTSNGSSEFVTVLTVSIMKYISDRTDIPCNNNMKIVAQVKQRFDEIIIINFRWLTMEMKNKLKSQNSPKIVELCWICKLNKPIRIFKKCAQCKKVSYCSIECQRCDWPDHKKNCQRKTA